MVATKRLSVEDTLKAMLTENTGKHFLDSGDHYGRNYEANQGRDFDNEDSVVYDSKFYGDNNTSKDICYTISLYHYLKTQLKFDEVSNMFNDALDVLRRADQDEDIEYPHWTGEVMEVLTEQFDIDPDTIRECNSYNHDSNLSQTIQYSLFTYADKIYVALQIHGGCDVRGGYTDAVIFTLDGGFMSPEDVCGEIDGVYVDNRYDGCNLTNEDGEAVPLRFNEDGDCISDISLHLSIY